MLSHQSPQAVIVQKGLPVNVGLNQAKGVSQICGDDAFLLYLRVTRVLFWDGLCGRISTHPLTMFIV